jgi:hypothetical protein
MASDFERLAFEAALRGLEKQERLLEELRARTGVLLAASSLAASFLGQQAFQDPESAGLAVVALAAFVVSIVASVHPPTEEGVDLLGIRDGPLRRALRGA